ncbi:hypothetical protein [Oceaniradius stylonematis]|uniref:hypothetical protein n=1 Tax=Oceaniradius stylonematis TaxID=2184161 RepID=UPI00273D9C43|nr:hypothetical protein [Oceaniradius stylonematis]
MVEPAFVEDDRYPDLPDWVRPGATFRYDFGPGNHNTGRVFHVRAVVDNRAVIREWDRHRQRWVYSVEATWFLQGDNIKPEI